MNWILESPISIVIVGLILTMILCGGWVRTGRGVLLGLAAAAILLTIGALALEHLVITDREQIEATLESLAQDAQRNDTPAILAKLHSTATNLGGQIESYAQSYEAQEVKITKLQSIEIQNDHQPPQAVATFNASIRAVERIGGMGGRPVLINVKLTFWKEGEQWKVRAYQWDDFMASYQQ